MDEDENEMDYVLNQNDLIKETSKYQYRGSYKRWLEVSDRQIKDCSEDSVINILGKIECASNTKNTVVSAILMIRKFHNLPIQKIQKWRDNKLSVLMEQSKVAADKITAEMLPTYNELNNYIKKLYKEKQYLDYIINFILTKYCVRNIDLNCFITQDKTIMTRCGESDKTNLMYVAPTYVSWVRRDYKTYDTYGEKKVSIRSVPFRNALLNFLDDRPDGWLFGTPNGKVMSQPSISKYILDHSFQGLGEGKICKLLCIYYAQKGDIISLRRISKSRGTAIETLIDSYMPHLSVGKK
jgi:hypothetical protein